MNCTTEPIQELAPRYGLSDRGLGNYALALTFPFRQEDIRQEGGGDAGPPTEAAADDRSLPPEDSLREFLQGDGG